MSHTAAVKRPMLARETALWNDLIARVDFIGHTHPDAVLASSLSAEDMVITHALFSLDSTLEVLTLDTGRLHAETLALIDIVAARYQRQIQVVRPDSVAVQQHVSAHGDHAFYDSVALRKACCELRKVAPLRRVLDGRSAWITGMRKGQSGTRHQIKHEEFDTAFGLKKFNPLASWTRENVWEVIAAFDIPYNPLHDQGYPSIGCEPCTRAIRPGEDERAGRWWWEAAQSKECGLHLAEARA